jgi:hypothetical protein
MKRSPPVVSAEAATGRHTDGIRGPDATPAQISRGGAAPQLAAPLSGNGVTAFVHERVLPRIASPATPMRGAVVGADRQLVAARMAARPHAALGAAPTEHDESEQAAPYRDRSPPSVFASAAGRSTGSRGCGDARGAHRGDLHPAQQLAPAPIDHIGLAAGLAPEADARASLVTNDPPPWSTTGGPAPL